jgi:hypothetical protein
MEHEVLDEACNRIAAEFTALAGAEALAAPPPPNPLYHYTSTDGLLGILASGELWATNVLYLNDSAELADAITVLDSALEDSESWKLHDLVRFMLRSMTGHLREMPLDYFVVCFCEEGDLLNQWRAYGSRGAGYSVGFDAGALSGVAAIKKVEYDPTKKKEIITQRVAVVRSILESISGKLQPSSDDDYRQLLSFLNRIAANFAPTLASMKHPTFKQEQEWRLVVMQSALPDPGGQNRLPIRFRNIEGRLVPYVALRLTPQTAETVTSISEVRYGPASNPKLTEKALLDLLREHKCLSTKVNGSEVPLRA